jgi:hypothetical protein
MRPGPGARLSLALALAGLAGGAARAESALRLRAPEVFGVVPAASYDERGRVVGEAHLAIEQLPGGVVRIAAQSGYQRGARSAALAELEPAGGAGELRLLSQESHSFRADGSPLGVLRVDHRARVASCSAPDGSGVPTRELRLPEGDRVVNVPMNLFFLPLLRGEVADLHFQMFLCRGAPRLLDFEARVERRHHGAQRPVVEVRYRPELGSLVSLVAQPFVPRLSFWFDPTAENPWLAHQLPLYSGGPEVVVAREGVALELLGLEEARGTH